MQSPTHNKGGYEEEHENPFATSIEDPFKDTNDSTFIEPDLDLKQSTSKQQMATATAASAPIPTGNIGSSQGSTTQSSNNARFDIGSSTSRENTLDEPVTATIMRDLKNVANKLLQVLNPHGDRHVLRDWDLWGPLLLCLTLAIVLSIKAPDDQAVPIFTGVFVIVWLGAAVVTVNAKLLGGAVSFFQSVCVIGYCLFPIVVSAIIAIFVASIWVRLPISIVSFAWSTYASVGFMSESRVNLENRRALAVYPLFLFYFIIAWLVLIL